MQMTFELRVHLAQDDETGRWYVAETDIPGLWLEADDPAALIDRIREVAPDLLDLNHAEILRRHLERHDDRDAKWEPRVLPVFDSPLALATA